MFGNRKHFSDYIDLFLLKASKLKRQKVGDSPDLQNFYETFFNETDAHSFYSGSDERRETRMREVRKVLENNVPKGGTLLDMGCGIGDNLNSLKDLGYTLYGLDYSEKNIAVAKKFLPEKIDLKQGSVLALPFPSDHFDCITTFEVLEHIGDQYQALREIHRVLKPGGTLIISIPYRHWFPSYYRLIGHFRHYTREEVTALLTEFGFGSIRAVPNYPRWHRKADYINILLKFLAVMVKPFNRRVTNTTLKLPISKTPLITVLFRRIEKTRSREAGLNYDVLPTSTFLYAKKESGR
jgi:ubiquinone/menaquinone biosynthesis C-methylase UbiE